MTKREFEKKVGEIYIGNRGAEMQSRYFTKKIKYRMEVNVNISSLGVLKCENTPYLQGLIQVDCEEFIKLFWKRSFYRILLLCFNAKNSC